MISLEEASNQFNRLKEIKRPAVSHVYATPPYDLRLGEQAGYWHNFPKSKTWPYPKRVACINGQSEKIEN
jgi:hypothetical protein